MKTRVERKREMRKEGGERRLPTEAASHEFLLRWRTKAHILQMAEKGVTKAARQNKVSANDRITQTKLASNQK